MSIAGKMGVVENTRDCSRHSVANAVHPLCTRPKNAGFRVWVPAEVASVCSFINNSTISGCGLTSSRSMAFSLTAPRGFL